MAKIAFIPKLSSVSDNSDSDEYIVSATYTDPETKEVSEGATHQEANPNAPEDQKDRETKEYGFKTSEDRVVDRKEAYAIAKKSKQLKTPSNSEEKHNAKRGVLHSKMVKMKSPKKYKK